MRAGTMPSCSSGVNREHARQRIMFGEQGVLVSRKKHLNVI